MEEKRRRLVERGRGGRKREIKVKRKGRRDEENR